MIPGICALCGIPLLIDSGLGHVPPLAKYDANRNLICVCIVGLAFSEFGCQVRKFELTRWRTEEPQFIPTTLGNQLAPSLPGTRPHERA